MSAVRHARAAPVASTSGQHAATGRIIARAATQQQQRRQKQRKQQQVVVAERRQGHPSAQQQQQQPAAALVLLQRACACAAAVALTSTATWSAPPAAAAAAATSQQQQLSPLAALMADDYLFADADADGRVSVAELASAARQMGREAGLPALPDGAPDFAARLYDLDGDGALTTDEMLRAMALGAAVDGDEGLLDGGVLAVFDRDRSGAVSRSEWLSALGPVQGGEAVADAVFARADRLTGSRGQLAPEGLAAALAAVRALLLGY